MVKPTTVNLKNALESGRNKISIKPGYVPSDNLLFLKKEIGELNRFNIVELVEPINKREKAKWLENARMEQKFGIPEFRYNEELLKSAVEIDKAIEKYFTLVRRYFPTDQREAFEKEMLLSVLNNLSLTVGIAKGILNRDDRTTAHYVRKKFGEIPFFARDFWFMKDYEKRTLPEKTFDAEGIKTAFEMAQSCYGLERPVRISSTAVAIDVRDNTNEIVIPKDRVVSFENLLRLIGHEIESHLLVSETGPKLVGFGGGNMKTDNEELYEGLAMLSDRDFDLWLNGEYKNATPLYYVEAVEMAKAGKSFAYVARELYGRRRHEARALEKAYNMAQRIFRGATNLANPAEYAFTKDLAYYNGLSQALDLERQGLSWLLRLGSFDLDQLITVAKFFRLSEDVVPKRIDLKNSQDFIERLGNNI